MLKKFHGQLGNQAKEMQSKVEKLESEIAKSYGIPEMRKRSYHLHSICVHDGNANTGHYYSFIFNRFTQKWWKYNDIRITEVEEADVFKESEGGNSWQTAQWLVYVDSSLSETLNKGNVGTYTVPQNPLMLSDFNNHLYGSMVPADVNNIVLTDNMNLAKEIDD